MSPTSDTKNKKKKKTTTKTITGFPVQQTTTGVGVGDAFVATTPAPSVLFHAKRGLWHKVARLLCTTCPPLFPGNARGQSPDCGDPAPMVCGL